MTNYLRSKQSRATLAAQHEAMNRKTSIRLDPACDGWFFSQKDRREWFCDSIVRAFNENETWNGTTAVAIISNEFRLAAFCRDVRTYLVEKVINANDSVAIEKVGSFGRVEDVDPLTGFSFCNHVAKRLLYLRKHGRLKAKGKKLPERKPVKHPKKCEGGTVLGKVS